MNISNIKKEITFYCTDRIELQCSEPIIAEAKKRGYTTIVTENLFQKSEIGLYCSHINFPKNSKLSLIMLHDLGQQHGFWPNMWKNEFWNEFDVGFLPSIEWVNMWQQSSCYEYTRPRLGCYYSCWPKADKIFDKSFKSDSDSLFDRYGIDRTKKNILYAPSWEFNNRQLEMIDSVKDLNVNLLIKQFPATPDVFPEQYKIINEVHEKSKGIKNVFILDSTINIFDAIQISDMLVSEESSTLYEAMLLGKPVIAVTDWLVPDEKPARLPEFPYDFAIKTPKNDLRNVIKNVLDDTTYVQKIQTYRDTNFPKMGQAASVFLDVIDDIVAGKEPPLKIEPLPLVPTTKADKRSIFRRKMLRCKTFIRKRIIDKSFILTKLFHLYKKIKCPAQ